MMNVLQWRITIIFVFISPNLSLKHAESLSFTGIRPRYTHPNSVTTTSFVKHAGLGLVNHHDNSVRPMAKTNAPLVEGEYFEPVSLVTSQTNRDIKRQVDSQRRKRIHSKKYRRASDDATSSPSTYEIDVQKVEFLINQRAVSRTRKQYDIADEFFRELTNMGVKICDEQFKWTTNPHRKKGLPIYQCQTIQEVMNIQSRSGLMSSNDIAFCWTQITKLAMQNSAERRLLRTSGRTLLQPLLSYTLQTISKFNPKNLSSLMHKLAKLETVGGYKIPNDAWVRIENEILKNNHRAGFDGRVVSTMAWALATTKRTHGPIWNALEELALARAEELNTQGIANTIWAFAAVGHASPELFETLSELSLPILSQFNSQNIANLVWGYGKMGSRMSTSLSTVKLLDGIVEVWLPRMDEFTSQGVANTIWAYAKLKKSCAFFDAVVDESSFGNTMHLGNFKPQEISNTLWAFAKVKHVKSPILFHRMSDVIIQKVQEFKPQEIANIVWAYAKITQTIDPPTSTPQQGEHRKMLEQLLDTIATIVIERSSQFKPQELAIIVWAYATLEHSPPQLFDTLARAAITLLDNQDFTCRGMANTVWAYAKMNHTSPELFTKMSTCLFLDSDTNNAQVIHPHYINNVLWSYATIGHQSPELFDRIAELSLPHLQDFSTLEATNTVLSYAHANHSSSQLYDQMATAQMTKLENFNTHNLTAVLKSYALLNHSSPALFENASQVLLLRDLEEFSKMEICDLVWSYATINHCYQQNNQFLDKLFDVALQHVETFNKSELIILAWAASILTTSPNASFGCHVHVISRLREKESEQNHSTEEFKMLNHWDTWCRELLE